MTSVELRLRLATADEIEAWLPRLAAEYAAHIATGARPYVRRRNARLGATRSLDRDSARN